ncbi:MAG TPA: xanthine dehydrogenase accessory protein XdhC [Woeseiaceae bacterium]|nr:xanthine dehydrogenase accessory protein XdhC [Woeseiaceae bacterium]
MTPWLESLRHRPVSAGDAYLVTIMHVRGSAPREPGAKMLVDADGLTGTIGGGELEFQCTKLACAELASARKDRPDTFTRTFPLGANLGQCCGGVVDVLFERIPAALPAWLEDALACHDARTPAVLATSLEPGGKLHKYLVTRDLCRQFAAPCDEIDDIAAAAQRMLLTAARAECIRVDRGDGSKLPVLLEPLVPAGMAVALFGAGHVGSAVIATMAALDCDLRWIDSRRQVFPEAVPGNVTCIETAQPEREVAAMPPGAFYLVMTHSHPLDYAICEAILKRGDFAYAGLIGSVSKRRRFERLMRKQGMPQALLDRLTCPIGVRGAGGKKPAEIAIAVAAELLQKREARSLARAVQKKGNKNVHVLRR